ncbi:MAG: ABC transporter permease [Nocardioidaceae bacterium]
MSPVPNRPSRGPVARRILLLCVVIPALVALPVWAFAWAAADPQPHELPIGVAGPTAATTQLEDRLAAHEGAFDVHTYPSAEDARTAIENREVYGAVVASSSGTELMTASAAAPAVAQTLTAMLAPPDAASDQPPTTVTDVVPADPDDPRGSALGSMVLPLVLVSVITSLIVIMTVRPGWQQVLMIAAAAMIGAAVATAIVQGGLGVLSGSWLANLAAPALTIGAIASALVGLTSAFGRAGIALIAPLMLFFGNPWAGASSSPYLLPEPAGQIGQLLPPGAGATMLRSTSFFDGAGSGTPMLVLLLWIVFGVGAISYGALRRREPARVLERAAQPLVSAIDR